MKRTVNLKLMRPVASWGGEDGLLVGLCSATWCRWCGLVVVHLRTPGELYWGQQWEVKVRQPRGDLSKSG